MIAIVARRTARAVRLLSILDAAGVPVSTTTGRVSLDGAGEMADVVVVHGVAVRTGIRLVADVRARATLPIVFVVREASPRELREMLSAGADGVVLEDQAAESLTVTLYAVHAGQIVVPKALWERAERPLLSTREKQTLAMVVIGFSNAEIARQLFVTEATVKSHLSSAFAKLGVRSRTEATALILDPERGLGTGVLAISDGVGAGRRR
ncbi:MAG: LuxR C-terminal-related transcriptional regulator [Gaiellaceae bacterium]